MQSAGQLGQPGAIFTSLHNQKDSYGSMVCFLSLCMFVYMLVSIISRIAERIL